MRKIEIIAECGINHMGDNEIIREMIREAANCGADTVKFQLYNPYKVFGDPVKNDDLWQANKGKFTELEWQAIFDARLTRRQLYWIQQECERANVEFLSSVSDLERLEWLKELKVGRYKIASDDAMNEELCTAILSLGKETLISDGHVRQHVADDGERPRYFYYGAGYRIKWLYCVSEYPTPLNKLTLWFDGDRYHGFSDHTIGITAAVVAMSLGAQIIEKHFTLDKAMPGPDHICSADPMELRQLCNMRDDVETILYND